LALLGACNGTSEEASVVEETAPKVERVVKTTAKDEWGEFGIDQSTMNTAIKPGDDFYRYVNGTWMDEFEIPADRSRYGAFTLLAEKSEQRVKFIIEDLAAEKPSADTVEGKVAALFNAYMDEAAIEAAGLEPAQPYLDRIAAIETREDLAAVFAATGFSSPVGGWVDIDSKQTDRYIFYVGVSGLGLPNKDYYFKDDEKTLEVRAAYVAYLTTLLTEAGYDDPSGAADSILELETEIAGSHWDRALGRNRNLTYNLVDADALKGLGSGFPVGLMLDELGLGGEAEFVVRQLKPTAEEIAAEGLSDEDAAKLGDGVAGVFQTMQTASLETWKAYLTAHFLSDHSSVLPKSIDNASFEFYGKTLRGQEEQRDRWKRAVGAVGGSW